MRPRNRGATTSENNEDRQCGSVFYVYGVVGTRKGGGVRVQALNGTCLVNILLLSKT